MLTAKYTGMKDAQGSAIAYGVYIPREGGKHRTHINADISSELGWLAQVSDHSSPHHHNDLADMWRALHTQGYGPNSRLPAMVKAPTEVQAAIELRMHHCHGDQRPTQRLKLLAATAALQSTGHLILSGYQPGTHTWIPGGAPHRVHTSARLGLPLPDSSGCSKRGSAHHGRSDQLAHRHGRHDRKSNTQLLFSGHTQRGSGIKCSSELA